MDISSQQRLEAESLNWLNRGRTSLLKELLSVYRPFGTAGLEILELGAGAGQNTAILAEFGIVDVIETSDYFVQRLSLLPHIRNVYWGRIPDLELRRPYDVVCALDVLEHIERDAAAVDWIFDHLKPGGVFVGTVPAYQWLFSDHDRANFHFRRYSRTGLIALLGSRLLIRRAAYFNTLLFPLAVAGRVAWQVKRRLEGTSVGKQSSAVSGGVDSLFGNMLCWEAKRIARGKNPNVGLSIFCVAERARLRGDGRSAAGC